MAKKILVTGGAGFIGSALIRHIILCSEHEVLNVDKLTYATNSAGLKIAELSGNYRFVNADITDSSTIRILFDQFKPNVVIHLAAETHVDRSIDDASAFVETNIIGTYQLLEASRKYWQGLLSKNKRNFRFHHVSTDEVYGDLGDTQAFFTELSPYMPSSPYSATKASADHLVRAWHRTFGLPVVITNSSNNFGPHQHLEKFIPHVTLCALNGKPIPVYGDGSQTRDWLFVEDHARALLRVALEGRIGETYNIGGDNPMQNIDVVNLLCDMLEDYRPTNLRRATSYKSQVSFVMDRPGHDIRYAIDSSKIKSELGWVPTESFESGLRKTVEWYLMNFDSGLEGANFQKYKLIRLGKGIS